jgi:hypothetical protein
MSIDDPRSPDVGPTPEIIALDQLVRYFSSEAGAERPPMDGPMTSVGVGSQDEDIQMIDSQEGERGSEQDIQETEGSSGSER